MSVKDSDIFTNEIPGIARGLIRCALSSRRMRYDKTLQPPLNSFIRCACHLKARVAPGSRPVCFVGRQSSLSTACLRLDLLNNDGTSWLVPNLVYSIDRVAPK